MVTKKIRKGDEVMVLTGKDRGKRGTVLRVLKDDRLIVENVNMVKRHTKPNPQRGEPGGIVDKEMPIQASNVGLYNPTKGKADRVGSGSNLLDALLQVLMRKAEHDRMTIAPAMRPSRATLARAMKVSRYQEKAKFVRKREK